MDGARNGAQECGFTVSLTERDTGIDIDFNPAYTFHDVTFVEPVLDLYKPNHKTLNKDAKILLDTIDLTLEDEYDLRMTISDLWGATPEDPSFNFKVWIHR